MEKMINLPQLFRRPAGAWLIACVAGITVLLVVVARQSQRVSSLRQASSQLVSVEASALSVPTTANGLVVAIRRVNISPVSAGRISSLLVEEGDRVQGGQLIAKMNNDELNARVNQAKAQLAAAAAEQGAAAKRLSRYEQLVKAGAISEDYLDELRKNVLKADANATEARQKLAEFRSQLDDSYIYAPFSGIITRRYAEAGEYVAPATSASNSDGATSSSIAELSKGLEVEARVPEANLLNVRLSQRVKVETDAFPGQQFAGVVLSISPRAVSKENVITFPIRIQLLDGLGKLKPEMNVKVTFVATPIPDAMVIPVAALNTQKDGAVGVFVPDASGGAIFRTVKPGVVSGGKVQIVSGLSKGDQIFLAPPRGFKGSELISN
jgi:HlyD family secretion protein